MDIGVSGLILHLFFNVLLVKSNHTSLELFKVGDVVEYLEHIILKFLLVTLLLVKLLSKVLNFSGETFLPHSEIINNQSQVLVDPIEVLQLLSHDIGLLLELLNFNFSWTDISLELLDLVIQDELELFKLLSFLSQVMDSLVFVLDGGFSLTQLRLLTDNLLLEIVGGLVKLIELLSLLLNLLFLVVSLLLFGFEIVMDKGQVTLSLHTRIDFLC